MEANETGKGRVRRRILYGLLGSGLLAGLVAARPIAAAVQGGGWHRFGGRWGHHGFGNPEAAREHAQVAVKWVLREVDATDEQEKRVQGIVGGAVDDLLQLRSKHQANREAFAAQLGGASVNREALEEIRKAEIALADEASRRLVQALADTAEALTPEQRQALLEHARRMHHR